jgi:hypothetical protein
VLGNVHIFQVSFSTSIINQMLFKKVEHLIAINIILFLEFVFPNPIDDGEYQFCQFASFKKKKLQQIQNSQPNFTLWPLIQ